MRISGGPPPEFLKNQAAQDLQILAVALFIQVLLVARASFASLFTAGYVGYTLWLWLALVCFGVSKGRNVLTAVGSGLVLSSRQTAVVFPPILLYYWFSQGGPHGCCELRPNN